jgi:hypothetical protein
VHLHLSFQPTSFGSGPRAAPVGVNLPLMTRNDRREAAAHLGLVPRERSSRDTQHRGRITEAAPARGRRLLVQAAVSMLRCRHPHTADLCAWAQRIAGRRGKKIARVALARRLAGILFAMLRDGTTYRPRAARETGRPRRANSRRLGVRGATGICRVAGISAGDEASPSQSYGVVGARLPPWPQYESRSGTRTGSCVLLDAPGLFDDLHPDRPVTPAHPIASS